MKIIFVTLICLISMKMSFGKVNYEKTVKVSDGTLHRCKKNYGRFRNRFGAYRLKIDTLQIITRNNVEYLQAIGNYNYYRCVKDEKKGYHVLTPFPMDKQFSFKNVSLDSSGLYNIQVHSSKAQIISYQDGIYKVLNTKKMSMGMNQPFRMDIPVKDLNFDLSESAKPVRWQKIDFSMQAYMHFNSEGRKEKKKWIDFGDYRVLFTVEKKQATSDIKERWEFSIH